MDTMSPPRRKRGLKLLLAAVLMGLTVGAVGMFSQVRASDHDDGETQIKGRNLNLTDLFVFREDWHSGNAADAANLIFIMCTNPRSMPRQQYFFNTNARYNFHVGRQPNRDATVTGNEDMRFEFSFGSPSATNQQAINLNVYRFANGGLASVNTATVATTAVTTPATVLLTGNPAAVVNTFTENNTNLTVFSGLREDPFFFDVDAYFRTRATVIGGAAAATPNTLRGPALIPGAVAFAPTAATAVDFTIGFNVNAIVMRVPITYLQANAEPVFDVWETISLPSGIAQFQ